jgi:3-deoxy-D-manno-octulosonate 8-phosphate phosphatase (KDO 8-P phosphatase)
VSLDSERLRKIQLLVLDVDGVLTDGRIWFDAKGEEMKAFAAHDGHGLTMLHRAGVQTAFLTGRLSAPAKARAAELGVSEVLEGVKDKRRAYVELRERRGLRDEEIAYMGDDLPDLPVLVRAGFAATVPHARDEVKAAAHHVTHSPAGVGAVREVAEAILRARGVFDAMVREARE